MKTNIILLLLSLIISNPFCTGQEKIYTDVHFPIQKDVKSKSISVPIDLYGKTTSLVVTDDYIIFVRSFLDPLFYVFDIKNYSFLGSFGRRGKGPNEFELSDARTATKFKNGIRVFDIHKGFAYIDLSEFRSKKKYNIKFIRLPGELYLLNDAIQLNNRVIGMPDIGKSDKMYVLYDLLSEKITYFGEYPEIFNKKYKKFFWGVFWRHSAAKPDCTRFVSFFDGVKMFRIYDENGDLKVEKIIKTFKIFEENSISKNPKKAYYKTIRVTDKYIYALCLDEFRNQLLRSFPVIEVWDWMGNPVCKLMLDQHIQTFDISDDGKILFAVDREVSDKLFIYEIFSVIN